VAVVAVSVALVLFALPLAIMVRSALFTEEQGELERVALATAVRMGPRFVAGDLVEPINAELDHTVGVYDLTGRLKSGRGPALADPVVRQAASGNVADGEVDGNVVVAVPMSSAEQITGVVRASAPLSVVRGRTLLVWSLLVGFAAAALAVAVLVARRQARLLTEPLEILSEASARVAGGDLGARAASGSVPEINRVAQAHNTMVDQLTRMIERQSHFSADASHQLRTPLSGLLLDLEAAATTRPADLPQVLADAAERARALSRTVDHLLDLAREQPDQWVRAAPQPVTEVVHDAGQRWHGTLAREGRGLVLDSDPEVRDWQVPGGLVTQIVDVLVGNAVRHGQGTVTVAVRDAAGVLAVDVADEGAIRLDTKDIFVRGTSGGDGLGIGLALARTIAEAGGGRLILTRRTPTTFTLYLPPAGDDRVSGPVSAAPRR
jgi:signal transduction histidine kinase